MKIVCFGDSLTARKEGHEEELLTLLLKKQSKDQFVNAGVSGNTTEQALLRIQEDVLQEKPDFVTILFGTNDSAAHREIPVDQFEMNLAEMVRLIGSDKVILITPPPVDETMQKNRTNETLQVYAESVKRVGQEFDCPVIDFFQLVFEKENFEVLLIGIKNDGLHFGELGYQLLATEILKAIEVKVGQQSLLQKIQRFMKK